MHVTVPDMNANFKSYRYNNVCKKRTGCAQRSKEKQFLVATPGQLPPWKEGGRVQVPALGESWRCYKGRQFRRVKHSQLIIWTINMKTLLVSLLYREFGFGQPEPPFSPRSLKSHCLQEPKWPSRFSSSSSFFNFHTQSRWDKRFPAQVLTKKTKSTDSSWLHICSFSSLNTDETRNFLHNATHT